MKRIFIIPILAFVIFLTNGCNDYVVLSIPIEKIDTSGVHFSYRYKNEYFRGKFPLDITEQTFHQSDSIQIKVKSKNPAEFAFVKIIITSPPIDNHLIEMKVNPDYVYGYHDVDVKPRFNKDIEESYNDSLVSEYFNQYFNSSEQTMVQGIFLRINGKGICSYESSRISNHELLNIVKKAVNDMPPFTSPMKNGDTVSVIYLVEVSVPQLPSK